MYPSHWAVSNGSWLRKSEDDSSPSLWSLCVLASDDIAIEFGPSRQVDYFSHDWKEEEVWASWRYLAAWKYSYSNGIRLEYALWRTWAKTKHNLETVPPETLDWSKDSDMTWLYGPLKSPHSSTVASDVSDVFPQPSCQETPNSLLDRKPILKKRTESEVLLQHSFSKDNLLRHASATMMVQAAKGDQSRHSFPMSITDPHQLHGDIHEDTFTTSSSFCTDSLNEERHVHFNNEVIQCVAIEAKDGNKEGDCMSHLDKEDQLASNNNGKTVAHLPPTRLKYHIDLSEPPSETTFNQWFKSSPPSKPAPTMSMDTMPPLHVPGNLLLDGCYDDDDDDDNGDADLHFATPSQLVHHPDSHWPTLFTEGGDKPCPDGQLQGTSPAMFMGYDDNGSLSVTIRDQVFGTVNEARHVVWDLSWW